MIENLWRSDEKLGEFIEYNTRVKRYSNGNLKVIHTSYTQFKGKPTNNKKNGTSTAEQLERYKNKRLHQRRALIYDIAYENTCIIPWQYFVTLTFNDNIADASNFDECTNKLKNWLDTSRRNNPNMRYIIVPELHKSGRIHFHGLFANVPNWRLEEGRNPKTGRKIVKNGSLIYNLTNYRLGYTTVSEVKDIGAVTFYITKYITKELLNMHYKKNYWCSRNLTKPKTDYYFSRNLGDVYNYLERHNEVIIYDKDLTSDNQEVHFIGTSHNIYKV